MQTQVFQRLRRIKQLGLANYVFPSADYSRLSHSLGVCHITGLIMDSLERAGVSDATNNRQYYRLAALLHDVGHLPLSHCTEHAAIDYYSDRIAASKIRLATDSDDPTDAADKISAGVKHEYISEMLLVNDGELGSVLEAGGYDPKDVASIFLREATSAFPLSNLISSDLDADRFDYLLRSSRATGLPYGSIDFDYLLSQMVPDNKGNVCIGHKGMRAAEHFLLCRYFDYQQVVYHKAVVGLEQLAQQIIGYLLANNRLDFSRERVKSAITDNTAWFSPGSDCWLDWDDDYLMGQVTRLNRETTDELVRLKTRCLIERRPPTLVAEIKMITPRDNDYGFDAYKHNIRTAVKDKARSLGIADGQYVEWTQAIKLTSIASKVPTSAKTEEFEDEREKSIRIVRKSGGESKFLFEEKSSLVSAMADNAQRIYRIYVVCEREQVPALKLIKGQLESVHNTAPW